MNDIHVGDRVEARGSMDGTTLVASEIKVEDTGRDDDDEDDEDDDDDNEDDEAEVTGVISGLTGTCPALTLTVGTTPVTTTSSTVFDGVTCAALANGARVEVEGERLANGSIVARKVELEEDEVEGRVSELAGTCPALTFKVGSTVVKTSTTTTFSRVACDTIANDMEVEVEGMRQADGSIAAVSVKRD